MVNTEVLGARCLNTNHFADAKEALGHPVVDSYTMHAQQCGNEVRLFCPWCLYKTTHDVSKGNPVQVKMFSGKIHTFKI